MPLFWIWDARNVPHLWIRFPPPLAVVRGSDVVCAAFLRELKWSVGGKFCDRQQRFPNFLYDVRRWQSPYHGHPPRSFLATVSCSSRDCYGRNLLVIPISQFHQTSSIIKDEETFSNSSNSCSYNSPNTSTHFNEMKLCSTRFLFKLQQFQQFLVLELTEHLRSLQWDKTLFNTFPLQTPSNSCSYNSPNTSTHLNEMKIYSDSWPTRFLFKLLAVSVHRNHNYPRTRQTSRATQEEETRWTSVEIVHQFFHPSRFHSSWNSPNMHLSLPELDENLSRLLTKSFLPELDKILSRLLTELFVFQSISSVSYYCRSWLEDIFTT